MKSIRTAIDLFCGCGGLSLGLGRAGFTVLAAVDNDTLSATTYRRNHASTHVIKGDIRSVDTHALLEELELNPGDLDLLAGCPPCQGFSTLRTLNGKHRIDDPMNDLVFEIVRFVRAFRPRALMLENVPALLNDDRLANIMSELDDLQYKYIAKIANAADYGVPQRRRRMILLAIRHLMPSYPEPVLQLRTVADAIHELPPPKNSKDPAHNYVVKRSARVMSMIRQIPKNGGSRNDLPRNLQLKCHLEFDGFKDIYGRMAWDAPGPTITGGCINPSKGRFLHPEQDRAITLREASILQGFPVSYEFDLSNGRYPAAQMIGNAFPPEFAEHHARSLRRQIEEMTVSNP